MKSLERLPTAASYRTYPGSGIEAELLLAAVSTEPAARRGLRIEALLARARRSSEVGFESRLLQFSGQGRVGPFLYDRLRRVPGVPAEVLEPLAREAGDWTRSALVQVRDLIAVLQAFRAVAIEPLIYKGPFLADRLYGGISLRHFRDLDLVVRPRDVALAARTLVSLGFLREDGETSRPDHVSTAFLNRDCEIGFYHPQSHSLVELHWGVTHPRGVDSFDFEALWRATRIERLFGQPVRIVSPEELWLLLAIHAGEKHRWERLKWVIDLSLVPGSARGFDWVRLCEVAREWGRERMLHQSIAIVRDLTGLSVPAPLRRSIATDPEVASQVAMARGRLFGGEHAPLPGFDEWEHYFERSNLASRGDMPCGVRSPASWPRWRSKLRYARSALTPGWLERLSLPLPRPLRFLHWIYRPLRLAWKYRGTRASRRD